MQVPVHAGALGSFFILECNVVGHLRPFQKRQPAVITAKLGRDEIRPSLFLSLSLQVCMMESGDEVETLADLPTESSERT